MVKETASSNYVIAGIIALIGCVVFIVLLVGLYVAPERLLRAFDAGECACPDVTWGYWEDD